jgi:hypothetical protein
VLYVYVFLGLLALWTLHLLLWDFFSRIYFACLDHPWLYLISCFVLGALGFISISGVLSLALSLSIMSLIRLGSLSSICVPQDCAQGITFTLLLLFWLERSLAFSRRELRVQTVLIHTVLTVRSLVDRKLCLSLPALSRRCVSRLCVYWCFRKVCSGDRGGASFSKVPHWLCSGTSSSALNLDFDFDFVFGKRDSRA